ncbi:isochorismatase family cysteine hydrolase [Corynebacterium sp. AOP40-9SA-29]|uniref:isochorismatase family cysteine hydrolase n=1 Tax=Corynebacterium sp. AOP40-9SA-29 TaxID=3457677 RepID=UPI004034B997
MSTNTNAGRTAVLVVDPYNDFLSEGGKVWPMVQDVAEDVDLLDNLRTLTDAARHHDVPIVFVPHRRWTPTNMHDWQFVNPNQAAALEMKLFEAGEWGGEFHPDFQPGDNDVVVAEHWAQNGFANTDLDLQLKQHGVTHVVLVGMLANTCIEATGRYAMELGYHVTLVRDATAAFTPEMMHAAHELNGPTYAHRIATTAEVLEGF